MDNNKVKFCGSCWIGMTEVDYIAQQSGEDKDGNPTYGVYERYPSGAMTLYGHGDYKSLEDAVDAGYWIAASRNYD